MIQKFISEGPTAEELQKAKSGLELSFLRGLESNLGKANQLINGAVFYGNPGQFSTDYQKTLAVTAADVKRVAASIPDAFAHRAERGTEGQEGSGFESHRKRSSQHVVWKRTRR